MQLCMVISDLWRHHAYVCCRSAHCFPKLSSSTRVKHRTVQRFAVSSHWRNWKPEEKPFPWRNLQSTILIGQVNSPSWGQLGCTRVPRPFLLLCEGSGSETTLPLNALPTWLSTFYLLAPPTLPCCCEHCNPHPLTAPDQYLLHVVQLHPPTLLWALHCKPNPLPDWAPLIC